MLPEPWRADQGGVAPVAEGYYQITRWRSERVPIPFRVWYGPPADPETDEILDRSPRWQIAVGGNVLDSLDPVTIGGFAIENLEDLWPRFSAERITKGEHDFMVARAAWASEHDETDPYGSSSGRIDPMTVRLPMFGD